MQTIFSRQFNTKFSYFHNRHISAYTIFTLTASSQFKETKEAVTTPIIKLENQMQELVVLHSNVRATCQDTCAQLKKLIMKQMHFGETNAFRGSKSILKLDLPILLQKEKKVLTSQFTSFSLKKKEKRWKRKGTRRPLSQLQLDSYSTPLFSRFLRHMQTYQVSSTLKTVSILLEQKK